MRVTRLILAAALALGLLPACHGDARPTGSRQPGMGTTRLGAVPPTPTGPGVRPGLDASKLLGAATNPYRDNTAAIVQGRRLFTAFNCSGCHSGYAGGGMGPNLRDSVWMYGSSDADLYATIASGRPNGMPAWGGRIPEDQIWQIIAYLRTLGTPAEPVRPPTPTRTTASHNPAKPAG
jgi:cytochrome c oxidase cbb3-type subunit 3